MPAPGCHAPLWLPPDWWLAGWRLQVRGERYAKLRHEKNKEKKKRRAAAAKEAERAAGLGIELPPKAVPKVGWAGFSNFVVVVVCGRRRGLGPAAAAAAAVAAGVGRQR